MKRRDFVLGATAGLGMMGMSGCASLGNNRSLEHRIKTLDMQSYFADIDESMMVADSFQFDPMRPDNDADQIARRAAKSLGVSSMFRDLPLEAQLHPGMQNRMWNSMDQINRSVFDDSQRVMSSGIVTDPNVVAAIKSKSNPGLAFLEQFDRHAARSNISRRKRYRLRSIGTDTIDRMRKQSPQAVFDEAFAKVSQMQRTVDLCGSVEEADRRVTVMRMGSNAYNKRRSEIEEISQYWNRSLIASNDPNFIPEQQDDTKPLDPNCPDCPECESNDQAIADAKAEAYSLGRKDGRTLGKLEGLKVGDKKALEVADRVIRAGGWTLGIAGITAAVGFVLAGVDPLLTVIISGTVGGILLIAGLIILSVGSGMRSRILREQRA